MEQLKSKITKKALSSKNCLAFLMGKLKKTLIKLYSINNILKTFPPPAL